MKYKRIVTFSILIGLGSFILMLIDFHFILKGSNYFGYLEFLGAIILLVTSIYFYIRNNFKDNPQIKQIEMFLPALWISIFSGIVYGILSWVYISFFNADYFNLVLKESVKNVPSRDVEAASLGTYFIYSKYFQLLFKFIGLSLFGLFYSIFISNHFLWIQKVCFSSKRA